MGEKMNLFEKMEIEVITIMLKKEYPDLSGLWQDKYFVKNREFTGVGFFSNFSKRDLGTNELDSLLLPIESRTISTSVSATLNNKILVGFVLFIENGHLDCLEGYTFGDDTWPEIIESYELSVE
jgi:hypothetical protein